jgi:hypothetical protein
MNTLEQGIVLDVNDYTIDSILVQDALSFHFDGIYPQNE